jgi:hypothetical protein
MRPTVSFGVPRRYTELHTLTQTDQAQRDMRFTRLKLMFTAARDPLSPDQLTFDGRQAMSAEARRHCARRSLPESCAPRQDFSVGPGSRARIEWRAIYRDNLRRTGNV